MPLSTDAAERLEQALFDATAMVTAGAIVGTAFFIDDRRLLTCAHVVGAENEVTVQYRDVTITCSVEVRDRDLDVAVLQAQQEVVGPTAVLLHDEPPRAEDTIVAYGFPVNKITGARESKEIRTSKTSRWREAATGVTTIVDLGGERIQKGMSGGPVLDMANGGVVGIVRYSYDTQREEGGGAIPVSTILSRLPSVRALFDTPARSTRRWLQVLGSPGLAGLTRDVTGARTDRAPGSTVVDLRLTGDRTAWKVTLGDCPAVSALTDLEAADVAAAVFSWAARRGDLTKDELDVLGRMLFRELMPADIEKAFDQIRERTVGPLLLRLDLSVAPTLRDVPWEYAKGVGRQALAVDSELALVRVWDGARMGGAPGGPQPRPVVKRGPDGLPERKIEAAIVVAQPPKLERSLPHADNGEPPPRRNANYPWPDLKTLYGRLKLFVASAEDAEITLVNDRLGYAEYFNNPSLDQLRDGLKATMPAGVDILHLSGFGRVREGKAQFAFAEEFAPGSFSWQGIDDVLHVVTTGAPPTLLVVQLGLLPVTMGDEALSLSAFLPVLDEGVLAVVGASGALHADLCDPFNKPFYAELRAGKTVEAAVQLARERLTTPKLGDPGLYGNFMACTTSRAKDIRLVQPRPPAGTTPPAPAPPVPAPLRGDRV